MNVAPCMSPPASLPSRAFLDSVVRSVAISRMPLESASLMTGTTRPFGRVGREADVVVALEDEVVAVERGVDDRVRLQRGHDGLHQQRHHRHLGLGLLGVGALAERLQLGDVRLVVVGDVRDHHPVAGQVRAADLLDARERLALDLAEALEVDLRPRGEVQARAPRSTAPPARRFARLRLADVLLGDPALAAGPADRGEVDAELAREPPDGGRRVRGRLARAGLRRGGLRRRGRLGDVLLFAPGSPPRRPWTPTPQGPRRRRRPVRARRRCRRSLPARRSGCPL